MKTLILVRHAEAEHLTLGLKGGWTDTRLTDRGKLQAISVAERIAEDLNGYDIDLYSSDLIRAVDTASSIGSRLESKITQFEGIREIHVGRATGMTNEEAKKIYNHPTKPILDWRAYPEGETWREFYKRVTSCMDEISKVSGDLAVVVSHSGTIVNIIDWWLKLDMDSVALITFRTHPAAITVLGNSDLGERTVERLNDVTHLCEDKIAGDYSRLIKPVF